MSQQLPVIEEGEESRGVGDKRTRVTDSMYSCLLNVECLLSVLISPSVTDGWDDRLFSAPGGKGGCQEA